MHDSEPDTFVYQTWPEKFSVMLKNMESILNQKKLEPMKLKKVIITVDIFLKLQEW